MKDEGPYILEWLAWHKAAGVQNFIVYTNDLSDGSGALLDHLAARGDLIYLENPAVAAGSTYFQPVALAHAESHPLVRESDYFISMDVDEFINVKVGDGKLDDLVGAVGPFDALSMSELNHGTNGRVKFEAGWVTEQFPRHQTERPGKWKASRGVKTILKVSDRIKKIRNHRSDFREDIDDLVWLDGSGRRTTVFSDDASANGHDCRKTYDLVTLEHFPLRSVEGFLIKVKRGDVVIAGKTASHRYFRLRNSDGQATSDMARPLAAARAYHAAHFEIDADLMELHRRCCAAHEERVAMLLNDPAYQQQFAALMELMPEDA